MNHVKKNNNNINLIEYKRKRKIEELNKITSWIQKRKRILRHQRDFDIEEKKKEFDQWIETGLIPLLQIVGGYSDNLDNGIIEIPDTLFSSKEQKNKTALYQKYKEFKQWIENEYKKKVSISETTFSNNNNNIQDNEKILALKIHFFE